MARPRTKSDEAILEATARAIGHHGLSALTLVAVANQAGVSPATLVQRFGSKRGLLLALARHGAAETAALFHRLRADRTSPLVALYDVTATFSAKVRSPQELANHLGFLHLDLADEEFRRHAVTQFQHLHAGFTNLISEAVQVGELVADVDPVRLARMVQLTYHGALIVWAMAPEGALADVLRNDLDHLFQAYRR